MSRLAQEAFDMAAGPQVRVCPACRGPRRDAPEHVVLVGREPLPCCTACGGPLGADGGSALLLADDGVRAPVVVRLFGGVRAPEDAP